MITTTDRTTSFRRRSGAVSVVGAALLFTAAELLFPTEGDDPAGELATDAAHHGQLLAATGCYLLASILFVPAFFALMNPVRGRGTALAHLGGGLAMLGNLLAGVALSGLQFVMYEASAPGVDRASLIPFIRRATGDPVGAPLPMGHYLFALGIVLLAIGLFRARAGYRWAAVCLGLAPVLDSVLGMVGLESAGVGSVLVSAITDGLLIAGAAGLAWWQLTTSNAAWRGDSATPVAGRAPEPAGVPA